MFGNETAAMQIYPLHEQINVDEIKARFDRFMVKDFVKSVQGTDFPKGGGGQGSISGTGSAYTSNNGNSGNSNNNNFANSADKFKNR